jgi:hypothetical protein
MNLKKKNNNVGEHMLPNKFSNDFCIIKQICIIEIS